MNRPYQRNGMWPYGTTDSARNCDRAIMGEPHDPHIYKVRRCPYGCPGVPSGCICPSQALDCTAHNSDDDIELVYEPEAAPPEEADRDWSGAYELMRERAEKAEAENERLRAEVDREAGNTREYQGAWADAEARLAAVEALCAHRYGTGFIRRVDLRAVLDGTGQQDAP